MSERPHQEGDASTTLFRLGDLRVDLERGEIRRGADVSSLSGQPLEILAALLRSPGRLLGREELQVLLWPDATYGDLDERLNAAVRLLRRTLEDSPNSPRYLETLRGKGYRICAPVAPLDAPVHPDFQAEEGSSSRIALPIVLVLGLILAGILMLGRARTPAESTEETLRLAVLPIEVIGDSADLEVLAAILDEELKTRLTRLAPDRIDLVGRESSQRYAESRDRQPDLPVDLILEGKLTGEAGTPRLFLHLQSLRQSKVAWSSEFSASRPVSLWFPEVARGLTESSGLSTPWSRSPDPGTSTPEAYQQYLLAMEEIRRQNFEQARSHLEAAIEADPEYVYAIVMLGRLHQARGSYAEAPARDDFELAEAAFRRAMELDPELPDAHLNLAMVQLYGFWDWDAAEGSFREALRYGPGRAEVHHAYAWFLLTAGRFEEAKAVMDRALELDPFAPTLHSDLGWFHYRVRDYPGALTYCHAALDLDPELYSALDCRHRTLARLGRFEEALAHGLEVPGLPEETTRDLLALPPEEGYRDYLLYLDREQGATGSQLVRAMNLAAAGRPQEALASLEEALARRETMLVMIDVTPEFDALASDTRFQDIRSAILGPPSPDGPRG